MKLLPIPLQHLSNAPASSLGMWNPELLFRYQSSIGPLADLKSQLPQQLAHDPRIWSRDDVALFLQFCEREYDLPKFDIERFKMNGKALCLLTKDDLAARIPGAGDVLFNALQMLVRDSQLITKHLPNSPLTPTSRYQISPHGQPIPYFFPTPDSPFNVSQIQHLMQSNSVTLSPAPSVDSQGRSPPQQADQPNTFQSQTTNSHSPQSDSDGESYSDGATKPITDAQQSPPLTPITKDAPVSLSQQISNVVNSWSVKGEGVLAASLTLPPGSSSAPTTPASTYNNVKREFFPDTPEPNTSGRLLWDFLQQLLNDPAQRYSNYIAWKCRDTGVFKIVDPPGLAKLWGIQKNHLSMNYDKMSRALRYYYRVNILRKVQGERHCYQFLRDPAELKSIKNISLLRHSNNNTTNNNTPTTPTVKEEHNKWTANGNGPLKLDQPFDTSSTAFVFPHNHLPPTSPLIQAMSGAFHHLSTSSQPSTPTQVQAPVPANLLLHHLNNDYNMDADSANDMPTDLSIPNERKFNNSNDDYYPLIRNSNGLTTIRLVGQQSQQQRDHSPSPARELSPVNGKRSPLNVEFDVKIESSDRPSPLPTDLRKMESDN